MDYELVHQVLRELRDRLERVELAIRQLESMSEGRPLRGRPPRALAEAREAVAGTDAAIPPKGARRRRR